MPSPASFSPFAVILKVTLPEDPSSQPVRFNVTATNPENSLRELEFDFYFQNASAAAPDVARPLLCGPRKTCSLVESSWYPPGHYSALVKVGVKEPGGGKVPVPLGKAQHKVRGQGPRLCGRRCVFGLRDFLALRKLLHFGGQRRRV